MKIKDLRPCDICGGKIIPVFYVLDVSHALIDSQSIREFEGTRMIVGGSYGVAEVMAPSTRGAIVAMEENDELRTRILLCQDCALTKEINLASLMEKVNAWLEDRRQKLEELKEQSEQDE